MKKIVTYIIIVVATLNFTTCDKEKPIRDYCNVDDPINELPWLRKYVDSVKVLPTFSGAELYYESYEGKPVFFVNTYFLSCMICETYYCNGTKINWDKVSDEKALYFLNHLKKNKIIWKNN